MPSEPDHDIGPGARPAIAAVATDFVELEAPSSVGSDALGWPGYPALLRQARMRTGELESVVCGTGVVDGTEAMLISFDFRFVGGSLGAATGNRIICAWETARTRRLPVVSLLASGGSRMQEGMVALHQLRRIATQLALARTEGIPHIAVLRGPVTGGVWATLGAGSDATLALDGAQIGFAGRRVRSRAHEDHPAFTARGQFAAGNVDAVLDASDLATELGRWLRLLRPRGTVAPAPVEPPAALGNATGPADGWGAVRSARAAERPRAAQYLTHYFGETVRFSGDRCGGRDPGMICGIGSHDGRPVAFAAQTGSATTPAGYRTATRLIHIAERLGLPVLTLVDTPGADATPTAEAAGLAAAIAELFATIAAAKVPITTLVIGEGGSGGALALAADGATWITPDGYFSVIAPELAARILKYDEYQVQALADHLRLRPTDLYVLGLVRGIVGPSSPAL